MGRVINTTSMTVDGVIDVSDWFVAEGDHDDAARSLSEGDDVAIPMSSPPRTGHKGTMTETNRDAPKGEPR